MTAPVREILWITAALLDQGRAVDRLSRPLTIAALIGLLIAPAIDIGAARTPIVVGILVVFAGLAETYFAARVSFDATLFHHLAGPAVPGVPDLTTTDAALAHRGLLPAAKTGRSAEARAAGAKRLLRLQVLAWIFQVAVVLAGAAIARR